MSSTTSSTSSTSIEPGPRRHGSGFWLIALAFLTAMAFGAVPTPLYPLYMARDGFSTFTVTLVFAVYVVGVMASLVLAGHVSDWIGRKKVVLSSLTFELVAAVLFLADPALPVLVIARVITGLGIGMLTAAATAHLHELHAAHRPAASPQRFEVVSTAANIGGIGVGPLVAGLLAEYVGAPLRVPYLVFLGLLLLSMLAVAVSPETVVARFPRPTYRPQRISSDNGSPARYVAAAAGGFASFALFGVFTSVAPGFVSGVLHESSHAVAGVVAFAVFAAAAVGQVLTTRLGERARRTLGLAAQALGVVVLVIGMHVTDFTTFLVGGIVAGLGAGVFFKSAVGAVAGMARPGKRSEALAGLFLISYVGLAVPAIAVGIATRYTTATTAMTWVAVALLAVLAAAGVLAGRSSRSAPVNGWE
jgi:MFS family permease